MTKLALMESLDKRFGNIPGNEILSKLGNRVGSSFLLHLGAKLNGGLLPWHKDASKWMSNDPKATHKGLWKLFGFRMFNGEQHLMTLLRERICSSPMACRFHFLHAPSISWHKDE